MKKFVFLISLAVLSWATGDDVSTSNIPEETHHYWHCWKGTHSKSYAHPDDEEKRLKIFHDNHKLIEEHNKRNDTFKMAHNQFSDLTDEEFKKHFIGARGDDSDNDNNSSDNDNDDDNDNDNDNSDKDNSDNERKQRRNKRKGRFLSKDDTDTDTYVLNTDSDNTDIGTFDTDDTSNYNDDGADTNSDEELPSSASLPKSVDWRQKGVLGMVRNQVHCGGCWAFAAVGALESLWAIRGNPVTSLSVQQIIDCDKTSKGCNYGYLNHALAYAQQNGMQTESEYPFKTTTKVKQACRYNSKNVKRVNNGVGVVPKNNANALLTQLVTQPVGVDLDSSVLRFYSSGVITSGCSTKTDHSVLAVGYKVVDGKQAFIVRNSWGSGWGTEGGHFYISTNPANGGKGVCGILTKPYFPTWK